MTSLLSFPWQRSLALVVMVRQQRCREAVLTVVLSAAAELLQQRAAAAAAARSSLPPTHRRARDMATRAEVACYEAIWGPLCCLFGRNAKLWRISAMVIDVRACVPCRATAVLVIASVVAQSCVPVPFCFRSHSQ